VVARIFCSAKYVAARRKKGYFPSGNQKNFVFRRATKGRPYGVYEKAGFSTVCETTPQVRGGLFVQAVSSSCYWYFLS
jgi:hypothetical protein